MSKVRGTKIGIMFFAICCRLFGLRVAYLPLYFVCLYYLFFDRNAVKKSVAYVKHRFPKVGRLGRGWHIYRLFISQGKQLIDRYAANYQRELFEVNVVGKENFLSIIDSTDKGAVILTTHTGNWQLAMNGLMNIKKDIYLFMMRRDSKVIKELLQLDSERDNIKIIPADEPIIGLVKIMDVLRSGQIVIMMGDRSYGAEVLELEFLNGIAGFPYSAFHIAAMAKCPIIPLFAEKIAHRKYVINIEKIYNPNYAGRVNRKKQLLPWIKQFVNSLEEFTLRHPYQCFLFEDIWNLNS